MAEQYVTTTVSNAKGRGTLGSSYTSGGSSLVLTAGHGARFPSTGNFRVGVGDPSLSSYELFLVTARSTDTLTVTGAQENTPAGNHSAGVDVIMVETAASIDAIRADMSAIGPIASLPSTSGQKAGNVYHLTDSVYDRYVFDGSIWVPYCMGIKCVEPVSGDFAWINQGAATIDTSFGGIVLADAGNASSQLRLRKKAAPGSTPYTIEMLFIPSAAGPNAYTLRFLAIRNSSSGKIVTMHHELTGSSARVEINQWNSPTSFAGTVVSNSAGVLAPAGVLIAFKLVDNGTNRIWSYSLNFGRTYFTLLTEARTTFFTADEVGFGVDNEAGTAYPSDMVVASWKES